MIDTGFCEHGSDMACHQCEVQSYKTTIADLQKANNAYKEKLLEIQEICNGKIKLLIEQNNRKIREIVSSYQCRDDG